MKIIALGALALLVLSSTASSNELQTEQLTTSDSLTIDPSSESISAQEFQIQVDRNATIDARSAHFHFDSGNLPRVIDLQDVRFSTSDGMLVTTDAATYYSELHIMTSESIEISGGNAGKASISSSGSTRYYCNNGRLYGEGQPVLGGSVCYNASGGGSIRISCSSKGRLVTEYHVESCPLE